MGILTVDNIEGVMNAETIPDIFSEGLNQVILMLFLLIVIGFYAFKLFVSQAQILILEILSPLVAVSVVRVVSFGPERSLQNINEIISFTFNKFISA